MENKTTKNLLLIIMGLLIVMMGVVVIYTVYGYWLPAISALISLAFVAMYGFFLYKKPHGNMLKYAMIITAISNITTDAYLISTGCGNLYVHIISLITGGIMCYGAGRLDRIDQNKILFPAIDIVLLVIAIFWVCETSPELPKLIFVKLFVYFVIFTTLMIAYFVRYKEHKEAGISDK